VTRTQPYTADRFSNNEPVPTVVLDYPHRSTKHVDLELGGPLYDERSPPRNISARRSFDQPSSGYATSYVRAYVDPGMGRGAGVTPSFRRDGEDSVARSLTLRSGQLSGTQRSTATTTVWPSLQSRDSLVSSATAGYGSSRPLPPGQSLSSKRSLPYTAHRM